MTKWLIRPQVRSYLAFLSTDKPKNERKTDGEGLVCVHYIHLCVLASRGRHSSWRLSHVGPVIESVMDGDQKMWPRLSWNGIVPLHPDLPSHPPSLHTRLQTPAITWSSFQNCIQRTAQWDRNPDRKCNASTLGLLLGSEGIGWPPASCLLSSGKPSVMLLWFPPACKPFEGPRSIDDGLRILL